MRFLKWVLVLGLLVVGVVFLLAGVGATIPLIKFKELEAHGVPIGLGVIGAGVLLAWLWPVSKRVVEIEITEIVAPDGTVTRNESRVESDIKFSVR
jgi:hypothetical protein